MSIVLQLISSKFYSISFKSQKFHVKKLTPAEDFAIKSEVS